jgi:prepilin-type N-terminal cleavage/methylation domain-containing protein
MRTLFGSRMGTFRRAFTLVELLVVIAIIGILVALLLPAIQAAREAGRRASCSNNLKQLGLSLQNHHDIYQRFPPGGGQDQKPNFGLWDGATLLPAGNGHWGSSWFVYILPYMEQAPLYESMGRPSTSVTPAQSSGYALQSTAAATNITISSFLCPSSPFSQGNLRWARDPRNTGNPDASQKIMSTTYAGISGFYQVATTNVAHPNQIPGYNETRIVATGSDPQFSGAGVLFPNSRIGMNDIQDGTTNVMSVAEDGDWMYYRDGNGRLNRADWRSNANNGWIVGSQCDSAAGATSPGKFPFDSIPDGSARSYGLTASGAQRITHSLITIGRYKINAKKAPVPAAGGTAISTDDLALNGVGNLGATNAPLRSAHPGGIQIALCDGSNRFITDNVDPIIMNKFACRDDGQPFEMP